MTAIAVHGAAGRMGRAVIEVVLADEQARLCAALEHAGHAALGQDAGVLAGRPPIGVTLGDDVERALPAAEVVIDFSAPAASRALLEHCARARKPAVLGTTGLDDACRRALEALSRVAPVVYAPNFSVGVNILWSLCARAVELAGDEFDLEIVEMHHRNKVDAPSGTAVRMLEVISAARGLDAGRSGGGIAPAPRGAMTVVAGRSGQVGARRNDEIGVHALRGGDVVGDHTLVMAAPGERIELTHRAHGRQIFARGAVRAAHWVVGQPPGSYDMADVLGIR